jgi:hypothetical protein
MINQYVFIINFSSLYDLLDEIKENLSFKLIKCENENDFIQNSNLDKKNSLIISNSIPKLLLKKNLTEKNYLTLDFPLSLIKILELINIRLIKLRFNYQSKINIKGYVLDLNSKNFSKNDLILKLTEKEIEIILYLNETKTKHNVLDLQKNIWGYAPDMETHTVETHIYRLRKKINNKFNVEDFILSHENGYFIE